MASWSEAPPVGALVSMGWALDMERRFYERGSLRRGASCVLCAVLAALPAGCGPSEEPPAKAVAPDSKQIDAAMRAIEAYMAADKPSEAVFVAEKLAACVQVIPGIQSFFRWVGKVDNSEEILLIIKTTSDRYKALEDRITSLHPYELPEIVTLPINGGLAGYLAWIETNTVAD